jgi:hypothetical protein
MAHVVLSRRLPRRVPGDPLAGVLGERETASSVRLAALAAALERSRVLERPRGLLALLAVVVAVDDDVASAAFAFALVHTGSGRGDQLRAGHQCAPLAFRTQSLHSGSVRRSFDVAGRNVVTPRT